MTKPGNKDDEEVAALYRVAPGEFTAARNALAKERGAAGAAVRTLEKPQAAAWAVNQLYWQRRAAYDKVIDAALAMRDAHARMLSGRKADVPGAEAAHNDAVRAANLAIRELAKAAGENLSASTLEAVSESLRALPSDDAPGRLTHPLKPLGFGALLTMNVRSPGVKSPGSSVRSPGSSTSASRVQSPKSLAAEQAADKKEAAERAARKKVLQKALAVAKAREADAESALADSRKALAKVERDYEAVRDRMQFLEKQRSDAEQESHRRARTLQDAANVRTQAEQDLSRLV